MKLAPILIALFLRGGRSALSSSSEPESGAGALLRGRAGRPFVVGGASCADRCGRLQSSSVELVECLEGCGYGFGSDDTVDFDAEAEETTQMTEDASVLAYRPPPGTRGKGGIGRKGKGRRSDSDEGPPDNGGIVNENASCVQKCDDAGGRTAKRTKCVAKCDSAPGAEDSRSKGRDGRSEGPPPDGGIEHAKCVDECDAAGGSFGKRKGCVRRCDADKAAAEAEEAKDGRSDGPPPNGGIVNEHADCVQRCDLESTTRKRNRCVARCGASEAADVDYGLDEVRTAA